MTPATETKIPFLRSLAERVERQDRGALATLRRGLGRPPGAALEMYRYVIPYLPADASSRYVETAFLLAALFAFWHQGRDQVHPAPPPDLGASLAAMADENNQDSLDRRFTALLTSHDADLAVHLRQVVSLLKSKDIPLNWEQLFQDVLNWEHPEAFVQRRWARSFWGRRQPAATPPAAVAATPSQGGNHDVH